MATLNSPGVSVTVIDESFYTPAAPGTVPLIIVASEENKQNGAGTGTAPGTLAANAGQVYLMTSQKDLSDTFGTPVFKTDANNNPIHAGEQNEYGLQAAYSLLGVSNRAYVVRANVDLAQLDAAADAPAGNPVDGTFWLDTASTKFGVFEWNSAAATTTGGQTFTNKVPTVITDVTKLVDGEADGAPKASVGAVGDYVVVATTTLNRLYFKKATTSSPAGTWVEVGSGEWAASWPAARGTATETAVNAVLETTDVLTINGTTVEGTSTLAGLVDLINTGGADGNTGYRETFTTNAPTAQGSAILNFGAVSPLPPLGARVSGTGIPAGARVLDCDGTTITLDTPVTSPSGVLTSESIVVSTTADDDTTATAGVTAAIINGRLELYSTGVDIEISGTTVAKVGLSSTTYRAPALTIAPHTQIPEYKRTDALLTANNRPTGSLWVKTTTPNLGAEWIVKKFSATTNAWSEVVAPIYATNVAALTGRDTTGGGINLPLNALYVKYNDDEGSPAYANFKVYSRKNVGATGIKSVSVINTTFANATNFSFTISESVVGSSTLTTPLTVLFIGTGSAVTNAEAFLTALTAALANTSVGSTPISSNITAVRDAATNQITIQHLAGGEIKFVDGNNTPLKVLFGDPNAAPSTAVVNFYADSTSTGTDGKYVASLWTELTYEASADAPTSIPADGRLWYNSIVDEVDVMIHNGTTWVGYLNYDQTVGILNGEPTDPAGPIVSATKPTKQSDGTNLANGDLWISTADLENYPQIYRYDYPNAKWVLLDNTDQSTENGILFRDARAGTTGGTATAEPTGTIAELLTSNFLDFDAPDPALYPKGMLLWNLRRSGFNVKQFSQEYVNVLDRNPRYNSNELMTGYYPHRWVSVAANQENGAGTFGRQAQRKVVVQSLQALVNTNQQIRDEESRVFNLIACPGYSELVGEMVSLNTERGQTAFVIGDTPARLTPDATTLSNWGNNVAGAVEDNETGLVTSDEYLAFFYPWGYTSDNVGNNVVVPPSHMMLRTIALSDNVSYPWFAPAGTRRGGLTNATSVGYIDAEGEFRSVALNNGQRDTLASIKVNPLTFITGTGLVNYGQYTRAKNASSLDRINVARLVVYLRRQFAQLAKPYVFEPNDKITRDEIKGAAESLLLELVGQRALYDYLVVCDTSNNTPARIDRNELYLDVAIEPVKAVEFIYIPLRLKNTGEIKGLA